MYFNPLKISALRMSNRIRESKGFPKVKKLEPGFKGWPERCPIANTINDGLNPSVTRNTIYVNGMGYNNTFLARLFISWFDSGVIGRELRKKSYWK